MMCCSKAEHTRKQNFPYLLIEDYSGASSDNLEEQEEIICDYRRKKYINICTEQLSLCINSQAELTESQASALTEITPDYIHSYITATQSGQIFRFRICSNIITTYALYFQIYKKNFKGQKYLNSLFL